MSYIPFIMESNDYILYPILSLLIYILYFIYIIYINIIINAYIITQVVL